MSALDTAVGVVNVASPVIHSRGNGEKVKFQGHVHC
jgi:hypothetical protein